MTAACQQLSIIAASCQSRAMIQESHVHTRGNDRWSGNDLQNGSLTMICKSAGEFENEIML